MINHTWSAFDGNKTSKSINTLTSTASPNLCQVRQLRMQVKARRRQRLGIAEAQGGRVKASIQVARTFQIPFWLQNHGG